MTIAVSLQAELESVQVHESLGLPQTRALAAFAALGQPTRLSMLRLLVGHEPCGMTVGDIAQELQCPQNTTSGHLAILARAGLVQATRKSRSVVYRADLHGVRWLVEYLLADCCNGDLSACAILFADICAPQCAQPPAQPQP